MCVCGRLCYVATLCVCIPSRSLRAIDGPPLKSTCVAVVHLSEVTPAVESFFISLYDLPANNLLQIAIFCLGRRRQPI